MAIVTSDAVIGKVKYWEQHVRFPDKSGLEHLFAVAIYDFAAAAGFGLGMTKVQATPKTMMFPRV